MCKKCGYLGMTYNKRGPHIGQYCGDCGAWQKWVRVGECNGCNFNEYALEVDEYICNFNGDPAYINLDKCPGGYNT
jgi:hypothetical protein